MIFHSFRFPTDIKFGPNSIKEVPTLLKSRGIQKPLVVTDKQLKDLPFFSDFENDLRQYGFSVTVYAEAAGNPVKNHVIQGSMHLSNLVQMQWFPLVVDVHWM